MMQPKDVLFGVWWYRDTPDDLQRGLSCLCCMSVHETTLRGSHWGTCECCGVTTHSKCMTQARWGTKVLNNMCFFCLREFTD